MNNYPTRLASVISNLYKKRPHQGWLKPGLVIAVAVLIIVVAIGGTGGGKSNLVSGGAQAVSPPESDLPFLSNYQFTGQGQIIGGSGKTWIIGGVPVQVNNGTQIGADLRVSDFVTLSGRILQNRDWLADRVEKTSGNASFFTFNGRLEVMRAAEWKIAGISLAVDDRTEIDQSAQIGDLVLVTFTVIEDGTWLASKIQVFDPSLVEPTPTPTETPTKAPTQKVKPADTPVPASKPNKANSGGVTVCHKPGSGKKGGKTVTIERSALQGHLNHGDKLGPCR